MDLRSRAVEAKMKQTLPAPVLRTLSRAFGWDRRGYRRISRLGAHSPNEWIRKSATIDGWILEGEHEFLWELATRSDRGDVLEIGTWMGKSACILSGACAERAPATRVFCVDTFRMVADLAEETYYRRIRGRAGEPGTFYRFQENAHRLGFADWIVPIATTSARAVPGLPQGFRLAFVDGAHDYPRVRQDVDLTLPKLLPGGVLALHDDGACDGVTQVREELQRNPAVRFETRVNTLAAFTKL